jgi:ferric-dicitrate binding protein FerR (iron transport regulator)
MKRLLDHLLLLAFVLLPAPGLLAQTRTAQVSALEGKAERARAKAKPAPLKVGDPLAQGDTIETQADSRLELKFSDASVLRMGPQAKLLLSEAHFGGPAKRKMTARLFFGNLWAKVTSVIQGEQKFQVETENAVAGVRGTTFRVDARTDKSVLVRVYAGAVAVSKNVPIYATGKPGEERREVPGPEEVSREKWEKLVGKQMQIVIAADGTPGDPEKFADDVDKDDAWAKWNQARDAAAK